MFLCFFFGTHSEHLLTFRIRMGCPAKLAKFDKNNILPVLDSSILEKAHGKPAWHICAPFYELNKIKIGNNLSGFEHECVITVPIQRSWQNIVTSIYFPLFFIELSAFLSYCFDDNSLLTFRLLFMAVLFTALFIFKNGKQYYFIKLHYNTHLDDNFNVTLATLFIMQIFAVGCVELLKYLSLYDTISRIALILASFVIYAVLKVPLLFKSKMYAQQLANNRAKFELKLHELYASKPHLRRRSVLINNAYRN